MRWRPGLALVGALLLSGVAACTAVPQTEGPAATTTRTQPAERLHFTAAGDYSASPAAGSVLEAVGTSDPDVHFALGDLSYGRAGEEDQWCRFVTDRVGTDLPFQLLPGNHESNGNNGNIADFAACLPNRLPAIVGEYPREYYVDLPREAPLVRFVMISPALTFPDGTWSYTAGSTHLAWAEQAITSARTAGVPWVVVGMHKPCLSIGVYRCDVGPDLVHLLVSQKVDLVLSGHEHIYQRTRQLAEGPGCPRIAIDAFTPACVVGGSGGGSGGGSPSGGSTGSSGGGDVGDALVAGAGTVFLTIGTGGTALRSLSESDTEAPYFAAASGANANPTHGYVDAQVSPTELRVSFVRAEGGTFSDSFALTRSGAP